jgi:hypothetical protein
MAGAALSAATLLRGGDTGGVVASAFLLIAGPTVWLIAKIVHIGRMDEAQRAAHLRGLAIGLVFVITWPGAALGGSVVSSLWLGAGEVNVSGLLQSALTYVAILPAMAYFLSELAVFAHLTVFARKRW